MSSLNGLREQIEALGALDQTRLVIACCEEDLCSFAARINRATDPLNWHDYRRIQILDELDDPQEIEAMLVYLGLKAGRNASAEAKRRANRTRAALIDKRAELVRGERIDHLGAI